MKTYYRFRQMVALLMVISLLFTSGISASAVSAEESNAQGNVKTVEHDGIIMTFTPGEKNAAGTEQKITVSAEPADESRTIVSIEADGEIHEGNSFTYTARENGQVRFIVHYEDEEKTGETTAGEAAAATTAAETTMAGTTEAGTAEAGTSAAETGTAETTAPGTAGKETSANETTANETTVNETSVNGTTGSETTVGETPAKETTEKETAGNGTTGNETTGNGTSAAESASAETPSGKEETKAESPKQESSAESTLPAASENQTKEEKTPETEAPKEETRGSEAKADSGIFSVLSGLVILNAYGAEPETGSASPEDGTAEFVYTVFGLNAGAAQLGDFTVSGLDGITAGSFKGKAGDFSAWLAEQLATVTATDGTDTYGVQKFGGDYLSDMEPVKYAVTAIAVPAGETPVQAGEPGNWSYTNSVANTGGHGDFDVYLLLYDGSTGSYSEMMPAGLTVKADAYQTVIKIDPVTVFLAVGDPFDPLQGVSAVDESGNPVDVIITENTLDTGTAGMYSITYAAVDKNTYETVTQNRTVIVSAAGVRTDGGYITAYIAEDSMRSLYPYIADAALPESLKSSFRTERNLPIDPSLVTIQDNGGYQPAEGTYQVKYDIEYPAGTHTVRQIQISVVRTEWTAGIDINLESYGGSHTYRFGSNRTTAANTYTENVTAGDNTFPLCGFLQIRKDEASAMKWANDNKFYYGFNADETGGLTYAEGGIYYAVNPTAATYTRNESLHNVLDGKYQISIDDGGLDINTPGTYSVRIAGIYDGTEKVSGTIQVNVLSNEKPVTFTGLDETTIAVQESYDLTAGVRATDGSGFYPVTVKDDGGFKADVPGNYTVTYSATVNGREYTAQKIFHVLAKLPDSTSTISLSLVSPADFKLGAFGQETVIVKMLYAGDTQNTNRKAQVNVPYGFEIVQPIPAATVQNIAAGVSGSYDNPDGTTFFYTIPDGAESAISLEFEVKVHLDLLHQQLASDSSYTFTADSLAAGAKVAEDELTLDAGREPTDLSDAAITVWPKTMQKYSATYPTYTVELTKRADTLPVNADPALSFKLPKGTYFSEYGGGSNDYKNCHLEFYRNGQQIGIIKNISYDFSTKEVPLYSADRFTFDDQGGSKTYFDLMSEADTVRAVFRSISLNSSEPSLKINYVPDQAAADLLPDDAYMTGSRAVLAGMESVASADPVTVGIWQPADQLRLSCSGSYNWSGYFDEQYSSIPSDVKTELQAGDTGETGAYLTGDWEWLQKDLQITAEYPYEYSPTGIFALKSDTTVTYTVSRAGAAVRTGTVPSGVGSYTFQLADGEYISALTVTQKNPDQYRGIVENEYNYTMFHMPRVTCTAKGSHPDGTPIQTAYTATVRYTGTAASVTPGREPAGTFAVTIKPGKYNLKISALDESSIRRLYGETFGNLIFEIDNPGEANFRIDGGIGISIQSDAETSSYRDASLYIVGDAVAISDWTNIYVNDRGGNTRTKQDFPILAYSTDPAAGKDGSGTWVTDRYEIEKNKLTKFQSLSKPLTGIRLDISSACKANPYSSRYLIAVDSLRLWETTKGFNEVAVPGLNANGSVALPFEIGFQTSSTGTAADGKPVGTAETVTAAGKTPTILAGSWLTRFVPNNDYFVKPQESVNGSSDRSIISLNAYTAQDNVYDIAYHKNFTLTFTNDGTPASKALFSLFDAKSSPYEGWQNFKTYFQSAKNGDTWLPFSTPVADDDYITAVRIVFAKVGPTGSPQSFAALLPYKKAIPRVTKTGYSFTNGEQLPYNLQVTYEKTDGTTAEIENHFLSARIKTPDPQLIRNYNAEVTYNSGSTANPDTAYETNDITAYVSNTFQFDADYMKLHMNQCRPTFYYVLPKKVDYLSCLTSNAAVKAYPQSDGTTLLVCTCLTDTPATDYTLKGSMPVSLRLRAEYGMVDANSPADPVTGEIIPENKQALITQAFMDVPYDEVNALKERGYEIHTDPASVQSVKIADQTWRGNAAADTDGLCLKQQNDMAVATIIRKQETGISTIPGALEPDGSSRTGDYTTPVPGTADTNFNEAVNITGDVQEPTTDWNIYMMVPEKGTSVTYQEVGGENSGRRESPESEFSLHLSKAIDPAGLPAGAVIYYTTAETPNTDGLRKTGTIDAAATGYVTADQVKDWSKVTGIFIHVPEMAKGALSSFKTLYDRVTKGELGTKKAYSSIYYNYTVGSSLKYDPASKTPFGVSTISEYDLADKHIAGMIWLDQNHSGFLDAGDSSYAGVKLTVTNQDTGVTYDQSKADENRSVSAMDGTYSLAVPDNGRYVVSMTVPEDAALVVKNASAEGGSVFDQKTAKTGTLVMNEEVPDGVLGKQNGGLFTFGIAAQDFSYGIEEGGITPDSAIRLAAASATDAGGNPGTLTLDEEQLAVINQSILNKKLDQFPLTFAYQDEGSGKTVKKTIRVTLKDHGTGGSVDVVGSSDHITADNISYGIKNGTISADTLKLIAHADDTSARGELRTSDQITVNGDDLSRINDAISSGTAKPGTSYDVRLTAPDGTETTMQVTLRDDGTVAGNTDYITADDFRYGKDEGTLTEETAKELAFVCGRQEDGFPYDISELKCGDTSQLDDFNAQLATAEPGDRFPLTFVTPEGTEVTVYITVKDHGTKAGRTPEHITANNITGYPVTDGEITPDRARQLADAEAKDRDGKPYDISELTPDAEQLETINAGIRDGKPGTYDLTFTTPEGTGVTIQVTVLPTFVTDDPPVEKQLTVTDLNPGAKEQFDFVMTPATCSVADMEISGMPMPEGSAEQKKTVSVYGAGSTEFGILTFDQIGTYQYTVSEAGGTAADYTYDSTVYTVTYEISMENNRMVSRRTITRADGSTADKPVFTNIYTRHATPSDADYGGSSGGGGGGSRITASHAASSAAAASAAETGGEETPAEERAPSSPLLPKTGDTLPVLLLIVLLLLSGTGIVFLIAARRRRDRDKSGNKEQK